MGDLIKSLAQVEAPDSSNGFHLDSHLDGGAQNAQN